MNLKPPEDRKTRAVRFVMTETEYDRIAAQARRDRVPVSMFIRRAALEKCDRHDPQGDGA